MTSATPFEYVEFYDVPRCIMFCHDGKRFLLQSLFDEALDEYPSDYSVYVIPDSVESPVKGGSWEFLQSAPLAYIGRIQISEVNFDLSKRKTLDAAFLNKLTPNPTSY